MDNSSRVFMFLFFFGDMAIKGKLTFFVQLHFAKVMKTTDIQALNQK